MLSQILAARLQRRKSAYQMFSVVGTADFGHAPLRLAFASVLPEFHHQGDAAVGGIVGRVGP